MYNPKDITSTFFPTQGPSRYKVVPRVGSSVGGMVNKKFEAHIINALTVGQYIYVSHISVKVMGFREFRLNNHFHKEISDSEE